MHIKWIRRNITYNISLLCPKYTTHMILLLLVFLIFLSVSHSLCKKIFLFYSHFECMDMFKVFTVNNKNSEGHLKIRQWREQSRNILTHKWKKNLTLKKKKQIISNMTKSPHLNLCECVFKIIYDMKTYDKHRNGFES